MKNSQKNDDRRLWLIDASYLFNAQESYRSRYRFDYQLLRKKLEDDYGPIWRAYYLNSTRRTQDDSDGFHHWLESAPPNGPKIITRIYGIKTIAARRAYCLSCRQQVDLNCPNQDAGKHHQVIREQQKGVDVGLATLALTLAKEYGTLILSSGDSDIADAVDYLMMQGKRLELVVFKAGVATELQSRADDVIWLDDIGDEIERKNHNS